MVLTLVLGTAIAFSSCSKDNDGDDNNPDINVPGGNDVTPSTKLQAVDLGLSVKWANMNVGAKTPEGVGDHFAWGETKPKQTYTVESYKWNNGVHYDLNKYCTTSNYGTVDNKTTLDSEDDAARVNLGGSWRMPTKAEMEELCTKCTWTWTTQNGMHGYKVVGKNGNSIFLPAAGVREHDGLYGVGEHGGYWSADVNASHPVNAHYLSCDPEGLYCSKRNRDNGISVRAVCP